MNHNLDLNNLPKHIAIIMDGNGRWARKKGAARIFGHRNAINAVRDVTEGCAELGVEHLTLYAFSTENWYRPKIEIEGLMSLLVSTIRKELKTLTKNNVRLSAIGDTTLLPDDCQIELHGAIKDTAQNTGLNLMLALNYSGRWDLTQATKMIAKEVSLGNCSLDKIDESLLGNYLSTSGIPDPELLIRTSGEMRISNFLLWQLAYTELYMTDILWPDFRKEHLIEAIKSYQKRERRFGRISEQVKN
ncbi:MAG: isoprenyl transferase [Cyclobacteriaceae bacterium]